MPPTSPPRTYTVGVEEEYQIIDPVTRNLASSAPLLFQQARKASGEAVQAAVQYEMHLSQIEVCTPVCRTLTEVKEHIASLRRDVITAATSIGKQIAASGTHPFAGWQAQQFSPGERYRTLHNNYQQLAREQAIFASHIHVGIDNRHEALQIINHARGWLALILALTGNSPFFQNADTGYASYRTEVWARWPLAGPPSCFASLSEYEDLINNLIATGTIADGRETYWDMRLSSRFNTIEVRVADVSPTTEETMMLAGLVRALIQTCHERVLRNQPFPAIRQEILRATHWQAARYGLDAQLINPLTSQVLPARQLLGQFLQFVQPVLQAQGDWEDVTSILSTILERGTGAMRQRAVYRETGRLQAVVDFIVQQTAKGLLQSV
jgi:carboxylate-amine ligase